MVGGFEKPMSGGVEESLAGEARQGDASHAGRVSSSRVLPKVLCVLGQTGAGKSKLAVELGLALGGEVVNCDAMQVYAGVPIATAQIPETEQGGVPHHMLGVVLAKAVAPGSGSEVKNSEPGFTVREFRNAALPIVENILTRGKVPLLVGGSDYYLRALVSRALLDDQGGAQPNTGSGEVDDDDDDDDDGLTSSAGATSQQSRRLDSNDESRTGHGHPILDTSGSQILDPLVQHARLRAVDPVSARKIHPNNTRRVRRYLEIFDQTGSPASQVFARQKGKAGDDADKSMRYDALFFAMRADDDVLDKVLRKRVDTMLANGMVQELERMTATSTTTSGDTSARGAACAIGFHEWRGYLDALRRNGRCVNDKGTGIGTGTGKTSAPPVADLDAMRRTATEHTKQDTCRLARRQLKRCQRLTRVFGWRLTFLDSTETHRLLGEGGSHAAAAQTAWTKDVLDPALAESLAFLAGESSGDVAKRNRNDDAAAAANQKKAETETEPEPEWKEHRCDVCDKTVRGETERVAHFDGRRHWRRVSATRKKARGGHGTQAPVTNASAGDASG